MKHRSSHFQYALFRYALFQYALLCVLALLLSPQAGARHARTLHKPPQWQLTFDEEFSGAALDPRKWTASEGTFPNRSEPLQFFQPDAVSVANGHLQIHSEYHPRGDHEYTSGQIRTLDKFSQRYGRLETRCRFPTALGTWSAIYLLPADDSWPPEIDAAEYLGRTPHKIYLTNHWKDSAGEHQQANQDWIAPASVGWGQWHTYVVEWQPGFVRWTIDGVVRGRVYGSVSDVPMYIRVNTSVGGAFAGPPQPDAWPQTFQVDYIRVYQKAGGPKPIFGAVPHVKPPQEAEAFTYHPPAPFQPPSGGVDVTGLVLAVAVMLCVRIGMRRTGSRNAGTAALAAGVGASALFYLFFRVQVVAWAAWGIALPLLLAEGHGLLHTLGLQYTLWPRPPHQAFAGQEDTRPLFLLIPTVNEGTDVLRPTVKGALAAGARFQREFPQAQVTVAVCNDGFVAGYPQWREVEELAAELGAVCVTRPKGGGAKAGNIEEARQALGAVGNALLVLFDADQIAEEEFLLRTVPQFADPSLGWVQTGQYYRNLDNPVARWANDQQSLFYRVLCPGKAALNSAFICGTNVVIRAAALDEIGGLPQDSVTEDFAASLLLHGRWRSVFLPGVLATGLGPMDLPAYFAQQGRWATGTLSVLRRHWRLIVLPGSGLSARQRVQYGLACTHYLCGLRDLVYLAAPLAFLALGISAISGTNLAGFLSHFLPYYALSQIAFWRAAWGKTSLRSLALGFSSFPVLVGSLVVVVLGRRVRFAVTPKHRVRGRRPVAWGQALAGAACLGGLMLAAGSSGDQGRVLLSALWLLTMLLLLSGVFWLGFQDKRRYEAVPAEAATGAFASGALGSVFVSDFVSDFASEAAGAGLASPDAAEAVSVDLEPDAALSPSLEDLEA